MMTRSFLFLSFFCLSTFAFLEAHAFMTVQESNDLTPAGQFKLGLSPELRTNAGNTSHFSSFIDTQINEGLSARAVLGVGTPALNLGGSLKWVPVPDYENQPAVGAKIGAYFWREGNEPYTTLRLEPIVSKKFQSAVGSFTPYAALPVMLNSGKDVPSNSMQFAFGSEYINPEADNMTFGLETGIDAKDSFSYISGYVTIYLEDQRAKQPYYRN